MPKKKVFKTSEEIERFFLEKVSINSSTSDEVEAMLDELGLWHTDLFTLTAPGEISPLISYTSSFKYGISCSLPARPTMLIFANKWMVYFRFTEEKVLAKIEARLFSDGI